MQEHNEAATGTPRPAGYSLGADPELLGDFIAEAREHLANVEMQVLTLEQEPHNHEALNAIFRGFHTIKGVAGFLDLAAVQEVAHEVETVLDLARNGQLVVTAPVIDRVLEGKDYIQAWLGELQRMLDTGKAPSAEDPTELLARIRVLLAPEAAAPTSPGLATLATALAEPPAPTAHDLPPRKAALRKNEPNAAGEARFVKVHTAKLDHLVDMIGEMVIAQSLVRHDPDLSIENRPRLARNFSQLGRITEEVQKTTMSMRMVPVGQLFHRMSRLVRDLGKKTGKRVELDFEGEGTELDRNIVEELGDPLMHMVRNSIDHGIETPEERATAGKPPVARITLRAGHHSGHVVIQVSDDGRGIDRDKILARAVKSGLANPGAMLTDCDVYNLIFQPGFSTAEAVTDVSGRGVGMDVVKKHLQKLRGRIEIQTAYGKGTTFLLKLPLTLAIIDGLIASVGAERYIIPLYVVREMLRPPEGMVSTVQNAAEVALVRGNVLPIVRLHERFAVTPRSTDPHECVLIVTESEGKRFCLMVDDLLGKQEVVIKSLGERFQGVEGVSGAAILGDGRVGLILEPERLFQHQPEAVESA